MSLRPRGPRTALTEAEQERIFALAELRADGTRLGSVGIAAELRRPATMVRWFMYKHGLLAPTRRARPASYRRKRGETVRSFTSDEDALMLRLRGEGAGFPAIVDALAALTGYRRRTRAIRTRLIMLAGFEAEAEERAELAARLLRRRAA